jgi:hypothetical protein
MKTYRGVDVEIHIFLTSALVGGEWWASRRGGFTPGTYRVRGWVGGLEEVEKRKISRLPGLKLRPLGSPARSQSLYRLSYPGSTYLFRTIFKLYKDYIPNCINRPVSVMQTHCVFCEFRTGFLDTILNLQRVQASTGLCFHFFQLPSICWPT